jgi:hypothetical protein
MSTVHSPVSDMLVTVKAREVQRGLLAESGGEPARASRHFLAAAHLELVLANDYADAGRDDLAFRSRLSAASCFWRAGQIEPARALAEALIRDFPAHAALVQDAVAELERDYPGSAYAAD